ncbi:MAG: hypothetical protein EOM76_07545 [Sphingobacteriia bacterium]|nr:hypothetical protein [Sphingobacteriia bacterium]
MASPNDLVNDYMNARISRVPQTPYTQEQSQQAIENEDGGNNNEYQRRKRDYEEEESIPTREEYEANYDNAEREIEYNSQRELDDLAESEPYNDENDYLEPDEFSGAYFAQPDEEEPKTSLGDRIRAKYDSFRASASNAAENVSSSFGAAAGAAAGAASAKYSRFKKGDPIFSVQAPVRRGKTYTRSVSRPGRSISRPYSGGRFGGDEFSLGTTANNLYYPVNEGRQSASPQPTMDMYLPSGGAAYEGEFSNFNARNEFKNSKYAKPEDTYDPFGFGVGGKLSADGFNNMSGEFGDSLLGGVLNSQESSIFGGMSAGGTDPVFGNGAMFNAPRGKAKKEANGFSLDLIIGDSGGMYNTSDPLPRKPKTKRKSASKTAKKATATKRKASTRRQSYNGFVLP